MMSSMSSEVRRSTLYQKPGPPTPSKNGGRLSLGAVGYDNSATASLASFRAEILREQNCAAKGGSKKYMGGGGGGGETPTGSKLRSFFSSKTIKDEVGIFLSLKCILHIWWWSEVTNSLTIRIHN